MANLPKCGNCNQDDQQRLAAETTEAWTFVCIRCKSMWVVSKPEVKARTAYQREVDRIRQITDHERALMARPKYFTRSN